MVDVDLPTQNIFFLNVGCFKGTRHKCTSALGCLISSPQQLP